MLRNTATMKLQNPDHRPKNRGFRRLVAAPLRALYKARDFYVRSMGSCASAVGNGHGAGAGGGGHYEPLPRSFSAGGSSRIDDSEDFRQLLKAVSAAKLGGVDSEGRRLKPVAKSFSVGMGRIDEDTAAEFDGGAGPAELRSFQKRRTKRSSSLGNAAATAVF